MIGADDARRRAPTREVRAQFTPTTVRVYQAFSPEIADAALRAGTFVPPFKRGRMTWIKPSFTWMMYRAGWGAKSGQECILGIDITRTGFEWALEHACISHFSPALHTSQEDWQAVLRASPVRIQWDPERTLRLEALPHRTIQIGLSGEAVNAYVDRWIRNIEDVTPLAKAVEAAVHQGALDRARGLAPSEGPYPLPDALARRIDCTSPDSIE